MLPAILPLNNVARPPTPVVSVGAPLISILPSVAVPAAVALPAFRIMAEFDVSDVAMFSLTVRSPLWVLMLTVAVKLTPVVFTVPIFKALLST